MIATCTDTSLALSDHDRRILAAFSAAAFDPLATAAATGLEAWELARWSLQPHIQQALAELEALHAQAAHLQALAARRDAVAQLHTLIRDPQAPAAERRRTATSLLRLPAATRPTSAPTSTPRQPTARIDPPPPRPPTPHPTRSAREEDAAISNALNLLNTYLDFDLNHPPRPSAKPSRSPAQLLATVGAAKPGTS